MRITIVGHPQVGKSRFISQFGEAVLARVSGIKSPVPIEFYEMDLETFNPEVESISTLTIIMADITEDYISQIDAWLSKINNKNRVICLSKSDLVDENTIQIKKYQQMKIPIWAVSGLSHYNFHEPINYALQLELGPSASICIY